MECGQNMSDTNISLDKTKTEVVIVSGNVELRYARKHPEDGNIYIARENLPSIRIPFEQWDSLESVLGSFRSVISWMNASDKLEK
jgi:hypothetical protein